MSDKDKPFDFSAEFKILEKEEEASHSQGVPADFLKGTDKEETYTGPERRVYNRRKATDRREDIRFDKKDDRRSGADRRKGHWNLKYDI